MEKTKIQQLYEKIPSFHCKEGCTRCCDNWVQCAPEEEERCGGFSFRESDRLCPKLKGEEGCSVYEDRPFICRLFGSAENLPCPYGYGPETPLTKEEASAILREYVKLKEEQEEALHGKNNG